MSPGHVLLAVVVAAVWGFNFVVVAVGLQTVPPLLMLAVRFVIAALPIFVLPRPSIPWPQFIAIAATIFVLQFGFLFLGMAYGMSPGMASVILQSQVVFTPIVAAVFLKEQPTPRQIAGTAVAVVGMGIVSSTIDGGGITVIGAVLVIAAALSWSLGNIQLRAVRQQNMLAMMVWMSLIPPLPFFALSLLVEGGPGELIHAVANMGWLAFVAILYTVIASTYLGHGGWAYLLKHYRASTIAPFGLLAPIFASAASSLLLGEEFGETRLTGMALVLAGLAVIAMPGRRGSAAPVAAS